MSRLGEGEGQSEPEVRLERRRHKRFKAKEGVLAFLEKLPGKITDISAGGVAVQFVILEEPPLSLKNVDIFVSESKFFLQDLPCTLVSICSPPPDNPFTTVDVKRLCIQFCQMNQDLSSSLDQCILICTCSHA